MLASVCWDGIDRGGMDGIYRGGTDGVDWVGMDGMDRGGMDSMPSWHSGKAYKVKLLYILVYKSASCIKAPPNFAIKKLICIFL